MMGSGMTAHEWRGPHILQEKIEALEAERDTLREQVKFAMPYVLADARRTLNTYGCADATYREAEKLAKYAKAALAATEPKGK